ncbi:histidine phosphatase family protein [cyanobacterium endosymbiont of Epithemia turgida]
MQAQQLVKRLKSENIVHILASPFSRTIQTAH